MLMRRPTPLANQPSLMRRKGCAMNVDDGGGGMCVLLFSVPHAGRCAAVPAQRIGWYTGKRGDTCSPRTNGLSPSARDALRDR